MPRPQNSFTQLAGAEVRYDRLSQESYGTRGRATRFYVTEAFEQKLRAAFSDLWDACPLGEAEVIASAGAYVDKPGAHGRGRAFDLDALFWPGRTFVALSYPQERRFYLAVEAVMRGRFGTVLGYRYDPAHRDHLHLDDLAPTGFQPERRSNVLFLQLALTHLFGQRVAIDGIIGPETRRAARRLLSDTLGLAPDAAALSRPQALYDRLDAAWPGLLEAATRRGFANVEPRGADSNGNASSPEEEESPSPLTLLQRLYRTIDGELDGTAARAPVEAAVRSFARHDATAAWLDQFRREAADDDRRWTNDDDS